MMPERVDDVARSYLRAREPRTGWVYSWLRGWHARDARRWRLSALSWVYRSNFLNELSRRFARRLERLGPGSHSVLGGPKGLWYGTPYHVASKIVLARERVRGWPVHWASENHVGPVCYERPDNWPMNLVFYVDGRLLVPPSEPAAQALIKLFQVEANMETTERAVRWKFPDGLPDHLKRYLPKERP